MNIKNITLKAVCVGQKTIKSVAIGIKEVWTVIKNYLSFADPVVEQICATNWGDGVGITEEQAAKVTDIGKVFQGNTEITSFDEFKFFTGVSKISGDAFKQCSNLRSIKFPPNIIEVKQSSSDLEGSMYGCVNLLAVELNEGLERIGGGFMRNNRAVQSINIPKSLKWIGRYAFINCGGLEENLYLPNLEKIDADGAFYNTNIGKIRCLGRISGLPSEYNDGIFASCANLTEAILPDTLTSMGDGTFKRCSSLRTVIVNAVVPPVISYETFAYTPLRSGEGAIYVPDQSVTAYREASGWSAYAERIWPMEAYLYGIITFADPAVEAICLANWDTNGSGYLNKEEAKAVTSIGTVFKGNTEITSFDELNEFVNVKTLQWGAFSGCTNLSTIGLSNVESLTGEVFKNSGITSAVFDKIKVLHTNAGGVNQGVFYQCKSLTNVVLPKGFEGMGQGCFAQCSELRSLNFPISTKRIESSAFSDCFNFAFEAELPNLIYGTGCFSKSGVTRIKNMGKITAANIAYNCTSLTYAVLPYSVTDLGWATFSGASKLETIIIHAITPPSAQNNSFDGTLVKSGVGYLYVPDESVDAYKVKSNISVIAGQIRPISNYITFTDITSSLASDVVYNTALDVYAQFDATPIADSGAKSMIYNLDGSYDTLKITGNGGTTSRLYCFIDENNEVITTADESLSAAPLYICIPSMARKMVICCDATSTNVKVEIGKHVE